MRSALSQFVAAGLLADAADVFSLTVEQLVPLERIGDRSAQLLVAAIDESRSRPLAKLLVGLGIRHVGPSAAIALARELADLDAIASATTEDLSVVPGVGGVIAESVGAFFANERNRALIEKLRAAGVNFRGPEKLVAPAGGPSLEGLTFVLTGTLPAMTREEAQSEIEGARRQGHRQRVEEDQLRRGGREPGHEAGEGGAARRARSSTRRASVTCSSTARADALGVGIAGAGGVASAGSRRDQVDAPDWTGEVAWQTTP